MNANGPPILNALPPTHSDSALSRNLSTMHEMADSCAREKPLQAKTAAAMNVTTPVVSVIPLLWVSCPWYVTDPVACGYSK